MDKEIPRDLKISLFSVSDEFIFELGCKLLRGGHGRRLTASPRRTCLQADADAAAPAAAAERALAQLPVRGVRDGREGAFNCRFRDLSTAVF